MFTHKSSPLPAKESVDVLVESFNDFFIQKIDLLRHSLVASQDQQILFHDPGHLSSSTTHSFSDFYPPDVQSIISTVKSLTSKTCQLDPIPTHMVKEHLPFTVICDIVKLSLSTAQFPDILKLSYIRPCLKKPDLDKELYQNYRPLANIPFLSKIIEDIIKTQIFNYLDANTLLPSFQSAYRRCHSTETALLRVQNDILRSLDTNQQVIMVLLDLSSAFDTLDHSILLDRLKTYFKVTGNALKWFRSYLYGRSQSVVIGDKISSPRDLKFGVPQGSILGPLLFIMYLAPLQDIILSHKLNCMFYADDTQIYITLDPNSPTCSTDIFRSCIEDVISWNTKNMLKCNQGKTEVVLFSSRFSKNYELLPTFSFGNNTIPVTKEARNLGVMLDENLTSMSQINLICKKAMLAIRSIGRIKKYLSKDHQACVVNAFVIPHLDYCNSVLYGLPKSQLDKLQRIQNVAARLVKGVRKQDHITPTLKALHWLPVEKRIIFKILLMTYKTLNGLAPSYLTTIITPYHPTRKLRSSSRSTLQVPRVKTSTYGDRAFSSAAPKLWNLLPDHIKSKHTLTSFKSSLKTFLFKLA